MIYCNILRRCASGSSLQLPVSQVANCIRCTIFMFIVYIELSWFHVESTKENKNNK